MPEKQRLDIQVDPAVASGAYSNLAVITHSAEEFVVDFAQTMPGAPARVVSRVIMTPANAKRVLAALHDNIAKYEEALGEIPLGRGTFVVPHGGASA